MRGSTCAGNEMRVRTCASFSSNGRANIIRLVIFATHQTFPATVTRGRLPSPSLDNPQPRSIEMEESERAR